LIHWAAETHDDTAVKNPPPLIRTKIERAAPLLDACRRLDVPQLHGVFTDEVFGSLSLEGEDRFTEAAPCAPRGPYSATRPEPILGDNGDSTSLDRVPLFF
jgi:dTDP-glucose 4,6-dehydratase